MQAVTQSLSDGLGAILGALPALIGAIIILVIGFIIAKVLQGIVTRVLQSMGFQGWMESGGIKQFFDRSQTNQTPLSILGRLVFWLVFFIAITMAVDTLGISAISDVLAQFIAYIPQIIADPRARHSAGQLRCWNSQGGHREQRHRQCRAVRHHRVCGLRCPHPARDSP
jgi:hypothetical protein